MNTAITLYRKSKKSIKTADFDAMDFKIKAEEYDDEVEEQLKLMYKAVKELNDIEKALDTIKRNTIPYWFYMCFDGCVFR